MRTKQTTGGVETDAEASYRKTTSGVMPRLQRVLLVDDDADGRELHAFFLSRCGFVVHEASDGLEGVQMARAKLPDVIVMDVDMPAMRGPEAMRAIRAAAETAHIPFILLSGNVSEDAQCDLATCRLTKPCAPEILEAAIADVLDLSSMMSASS